ncbi:MAG: type II toxin-antitoxin system YoeB family toxin [Acidiferrobacteraceae bacterium]
MAVDIVEVYWTKQAAEDRNYWPRRDRRMTKKIEDLIKAIRLDPYLGTELVTDR